MERVLGIAFLWGVGLAAACSGPQEPGGEGAECYRDRDCQVGLVCVGTTQARRCSSDVSTLVSTVDGALPPADAGMPTDDAEVPVDDAAPMDPEDASEPMDPEDAGEPTDPEDAG